MPLVKYISMPSRALVSRRANTGEASRTHALKSIQPGRSTVARQMPSGPESSAPHGSPGAQASDPSSLRGVRPPPAPFTRILTSSVGHRSQTASHTSAMSPTEVATTALTPASSIRYDRSCSLSMKVAGTMTAPSLCRAVATNQNW